mmetsp:Transcript_16718/g.24504  ORF Transcript_16718/g.24504 Transcript_16718/m.24504 type:complete len:504 (-) Transcript_16718:87-1598(-)
MKEDKYQLNRQELRKMAKKVPYCSEVKSDPQHPPPNVKRIRPYILSFLIATNPEPARIEVYCDTATVSTLRVFDGRIRHIMERNCSMNRVEEIFRDPPHLSLVKLDLELNMDISTGSGGGGGGTDESAIANNVNGDGESSSSKHASPRKKMQASAATSPNNKRRISSGSVNSNRSSPSSEISKRTRSITKAITFGHNRTSKQEKREIIENDLTLLDIGEAVLRSESDLLRTHHKIALAAVEVKVLPDEDDARISNSGVADGSSAAFTNNPLNGAIGGGAGKKKNKKDQEYACSFQEHLMTQVEDILQSTNGKQFMTCAATNGKAAIFLYRNGKHDMTDGLPKPLISQIQKHGLRRSTLKYISLGSKGRYFMSFRGGKKCWEGPKSMDALVSKKLIRTIAFGKSMEDFFCIYNDGSWKSHGTMPTGLEKLLMEERKQRGDLICVTLGSNGEYFVKAKNGRMWWGGVTDEIDQVFDEMVSSTEVNRTLQFVDFGNLPGSYFMIYD